MTDPANASNTLIYYLNLGSTVCSLECPVGQYRRDGYPNVCQMCSPECGGCFKTSTNCTEAHKCALNYFFYRPTNSCIQACPTGYYANITTQTCEFCAGGCSSCQSGDLLNCQGCQTDPVTNISYFKEMNADICVSTCAAGTYALLVDNTCRACYITCVLCVNDSTTCQQCRNVSGINYFYYDNKCLATCPDGYYGEKTNNTCVPCHPGCSLCFGSAPTQCTACKPDTSVTPTDYYYLNFGTNICSTTCPYGQYAVNSSNTC